MTVKIDIITCPEWKAAPPKREASMVKKSVRIIDHHTAGHATTPTVSKPPESIESAKAYARAIQRSHMRPGGLGAVNGGNDSGHNFLVMRSGLILQGRWGTVSAIQHGLMVASAHCPDENDQIGIEHEHDGHESMTLVQGEASARLRAWIADCYRRTSVLPSLPHRKFFATECPANLDFVAVNRRAQTILDKEGGL